MIYMICSGSGLFDEKETLVEVLQDQFKIEDLQIEFEKRITDTIGEKPGTRKHAVARRAWLREFLDVKRLVNDHSEIDAFIDWMCGLGYARKLNFERYVT